MYQGKKAVESYIIILFFFSVVMTLVLVFVLDAFYGVDHPDCQEISYIVKNQCKDKALVDMDIENENSERDTRFLINGVRNADYYVEAGQTASMRVNGGTGTVSIVPIVVVDGNTYQCESKKKIINVEETIRCTD
ncbi:MAG: hypothetical protein H6500_01365 [Candidatus Woesearchaeota archaeon]|nr:MAG: hypothetical protein H6500_01365 [Candidatus Woesearchaeota archaeon]